MYSTLQKGDAVIINKLIYGARLPMTPLVVGDKFLDWIKIPYVRVPGIAAYQRNDVVAFNYDAQDDVPVDLQKNYIKRCVALPGDSIEISEGRVICNGRELVTDGLCHKYKLIATAPLDSLFVTQKVIKESYHFNGFHYYLIIIDEQTAAELRTSPFIKNIQQVQVLKTDYHPAIFPHNSSISWNKDFFGPLWIPKKGDSILLNVKNWLLYGQLISRFEKANITQLGDKYFNAQQSIKYFIFSQNYFFLLGDNRDNSIDSRFFGLIPEDHIIGKATTVLYSQENPIRRFSSIK